MPIEQGKLYRSNINYQPPQRPSDKDSIKISDHVKQITNRKEHPAKTTLIHTSSQSNIRKTDLLNSPEGSKQTLPYNNKNNVLQSSFFSIDDAYLNVKFVKKSQNNQNKIINNLTEMQSDTQSLGGRSLKTYQGADQYYKYWKTKAHEYLDQNFKLREQNKKLKSQIDNLNLNSKTKTQSNQYKTPEVVKSQTNQREQKSFSYLENIFKKKLEDLSNQIKQKNYKINNLQDKVMELNRKIMGEQQRSQLITRLGQQVDMLSRQNISLKKQINQIENKEKRLQQLQIDSNIQNKRYNSRQKKGVNYRKSPPKTNKKQLN